MSGFSAAWLALREPADTAARSAALTRVIADALRSRDVVRAVDLASGTGANVRYLASRMPAPQRWLLVDSDASLLAHAPPGHETRVEDLSTPGRDAAAVTFTTLFAGRDLVTASALLDLVSEAWVTALAARCRAAGSLALFTLSYDGRILFTPDDADDERVRALVNRHQRTDKGFGPALGPDAARVTAERFRACGYDVRVERSDWVLSPVHGELQRELIDGWVSAAIELEPADAPRLREWRARRLALVEAGESDLVVGHEDVAAIRG